MKSSNENNSLVHNVSSDLYNGMSGPIDMIDEVYNLWCPRDHDEMDPRLFYAITNHIYIYI